MYKIVTKKCLYFLKLKLCFSFSTSCSKQKGAKVFFSCKLIIIAFYKKAFQQHWCTSMMILTLISYYHQHHLYFDVQLMQIKKKKSNAHMLHNGITCQCCISKRAVNIMAHALCMEKMKSCAQQEAAVCVKKGGPVQHKVIRTFYFFCIFFPPVSEKVIWGSQGAIFEPAFQLPHTPHPVSVEP